jgi:hypothetical protein
MIVRTEIDWRDGRHSERLIDWERRDLVRGFAKVANSALRRGARVTTQAEETCENPAGNSGTSNG